MSQSKQFDRRSFLAAATLWNIGNAQLLEGGQPLLDIVQMVLDQGQTFEADHLSTFKSAFRRVEGIQLPDEVARTYTEEQVVYICKTVNRILKDRLGEYFQPYLLTTGSHPLMGTGDSSVILGLAHDVMLTINAGIAQDHITVEAWVQQPRRGHVEETEIPRLIYGYALRFGAGHQLIAAQQSYSTFGEDTLQDAVVKVLRTALRPYVFTDLQHMCLSHEIYRLTQPGDPSQVPN